MVFYGPFWLFMVFDVFVLSFLAVIDPKSLVLVWVKAYAIIIFKKVIQTKRRRQSCMY